jgi:hypothetical protein
MSRFGAQRGQRQAFVDELQKSFNGDLGIVALDIRVEQGTNGNQREPWASPEGAGALRRLCGVPAAKDGALGLHGARRRTQLDSGPSRAIRRGCAGLTFKLDVGKATVARSAGGCTQMR